MNRAFFFKSVQNREKQEGMIWERNNKKKNRQNVRKKTNIALFFYCRVKERTYVWNWQNYHTRKKKSYIDRCEVNQKKSRYLSKQNDFNPGRVESIIISTDHILSVTKISIYSLVEKKEKKARGETNGKFKCGSNTF